MEQHIKQVLISPCNVISVFLIVVVHVIEPCEGSYPSEIHQHYS